MTPDWPEKAMGLPVLSLPRIQRGGPRAVGGDWAIETRDGSRANWGQSSARAAPAARRTTARRLVGRRSGADRGHSAAAAAERARDAVGGVRVGGAGVGEDGQVDAEGVGGIVGYRLCERDRERAAGTDRHQFGPEEGRIEGSDRAGE